MGLRDKFNDFNNDRKRKKRFEKYNAIIDKSDAFSLGELSNQTGVGTDQVRKDIQEYLHYLDERESFFKNRYWLDTSNETLHKKPWIAGIKDFKSYKSGVYAILVLLIIVIVGGAIAIGASLNNRNNGSHSAKLESSLSSKASKSQSEGGKASSSSSSSESKKENAEVLKITKRKNDVKVDSGNGEYIGKSSVAGKISFTADSAKLNDGTYQLKWIPGVWRGSDSNYAYATVTTNDDNDNLIQISYDDPQTITIKKSDTINVQMFGKGTGDTLRFYKAEK
ncbi:hypothetical protein PUF88_06715 [Lactobacillaceae bacterium L1_55_11]|nr:hypothetical protein [Lactobacillaceae bacterium L1_55_11]